MDNFLVALEQFFSVQYLALQQISHCLFTLCSFHITSVRRPILHCNKSVTVRSPFVRFISHLCAVPYYDRSSFYSSFAAVQSSLFLRYFSCPDNSFPSIIMFFPRVLFRAVTRIEISLMKTKAEDTKKSLFGLKPTKVFNPEVIESFCF